MGQAVNFLLAIAPCIRALETESENRILCVNMTPERPFA